MKLTKLLDSKMVKKKKKNELLKIYIDFSIL